MILPKYYKQIITYGLLILIIMAGFFGWESRHTGGWEMLLGLTLCLWLVSFFAPKKNNTFPMSLIIFAIIALITSLTGIYKFNSLISFYQLLIFLLAFYLIINFASDNRIKHFIQVILVTALITGLYSLYSFFNVVNWELGLGSIYGWKNIFAGYLVLILPLAFALYLQHNSKKTQLYYGLINLVLLACLTLTLSRAGWLAAIIALLLTIIFIKNIKWKTKILKTLIIAILTFVLVFGLVSLHKSLQPVLVEPALTETVENTQTIDEAELNVSLFSRLNYWTASLKMFVDDPILGIGLNNYYLRYPQYQQNLWSSTNDPHNFILYYLVSCGIFGLAFFLLFLSKIFIKGLIYILKNDDRYIVGLYFGVLASVLHALVDADWNVPSILLLVFIMLALIVKISHIKFFEFKQLNNNLYKILQALTVTFLFTTILLYGYTENIQNTHQTSLNFAEPKVEVADYQKLTQIIPLSANYHLNLANAFLRKNLLDKEENFDDFYLSAEKAIALSPNNHQQYSWYGQNLTFLEKRGVATNRLPQKYFEQAMTLQPYRLVNYYNLADSLISQEKYLAAGLIILSAQEIFTELSMSQTVYSPKLYQEDMAMLKKMEVMQMLIEEKMKIK